MNREMPLWERIEKNTFPGFQGTPSLNNIAAKGVFFKEMLSAEYHDRQFGIVENAKILAQEFLRRGYDVLTGGTDNHMFLVNIANFRPRREATSGRKLTGFIAQHCLEDCGIIINQNRLPYDTHSARITSGMRLGTPIVTKNGMGHTEMQTIAQWVDDVLNRVEVQTDRQYHLDPAFQNEMRQRVQELCTRFPMQ